MSMIRSLVRSLINSAVQSQEEPGGSSSKAALKFNKASNSQYLGSVI